MTPTARWATLCPIGPNLSLQTPSEPATKPSALPYGDLMEPDAESISATKRRLRKTLIANRRARSTVERHAAQAAVTAHLTSALGEATSIAAFLPLPTEPLEIGALEELAASSQVLVPVVTGPAPLDWCAFGGPTVPGALGIGEPIGPRLGAAAIGSVDAVLVPALAVDPQGRRLGRGGGHYDRTLQLLSQLRLRQSPPLIAIVYDDELLDVVPGEHFDQRVNAVITPGQGLRSLI